MQVRFRLPRAAGLEAGKWTQAATQDSPQVLRPTRPEAPEARLRVAQAVLRWAAQAVLAVRLALLERLRVAEAALARGREECFPVLAPLG